MKKFFYLLIITLVIGTACQFLLPPSAYEEYIENKINSTNQTPEPVFYEYFEVEYDEILILMDTSGSMNDPSSNKMIIPFVYGNLGEINPGQFANYDQVIQYGINRYGFGSHTMGHYNDYWYFYIPLSNKTTNIIRFLPYNFQTNHWDALQTNFTSNVGTLNNVTDSINIVLSGNNIESVKTFLGNPITEFDDKPIDGIAVPENRKVIRLSLSNMGDWFIITNKYQDGADTNTNTDPVPTK